jgi:hypothetical protein
MSGATAFFGNGGLNDALPTSWGLRPEDRRPPKGRGLSRPALTG